MGNANAQARIGRDYLYGGDGVAVDTKKALPLIEKAAANGSPWACGSLGEILSKGELLPKDQQKAASLFQQGAALGDPPSQFEYAQILLQTNPAKAYPWIKLAVEAHEVRAYGLMTECRHVLTPEQAATGDAEAEKIRENYQMAPSSK
jgi:TPR repeat protein